MHSDDKVRAVFALLGEGVIHREIAARTGVSITQVRKWLYAGEDTVLRSPMRQMTATHDSAECSLIPALPTKDYSYLLGQYLGDGHIVRMRNGVYRLGITTCDEYPLIREECAAAIATVMPDRSVYAVAKEGCADVACYSKHWPCLFPQHGPGRKHERRIELAPWQETIALELHPELFIRGLIHSDGCRAINRVMSKGRRYEYLRYFFKNESADLRWLFIEACERVGVAARHNYRNSVSVARKDSVAVLEDLVGPKR